MAATRLPPGAAARLAFDRARGRMRQLVGRADHEKFRGTFPTHQAALAAVRPGLAGGYDNHELVDVAYAEMCRMHLWDYPVLHWLGRLAPHHDALIDAGGHMGTKFRAFRPYLTLADGFEWAVFDLPAIVSEGTRRAARDGLPNLQFHARLDTLPHAQIMLASGLFQYLEHGPAEFLRSLPALPRHLLLNKVATRDGGSVVTLERFPHAEVPYHVRDRAGFEGELAALGYEVCDRWAIPAFSRRHPAFGQSHSFGYYAVRRD